MRLMTGSEQKDALFPDEERIIVPAEFVLLVASRPEIEVLIAIRACETHGAVEQFWAAEKCGRKRPSVIAAAERKMDQLTTQV